MPTYYLCGIGIVPTDGDLRPLNSLRCRIQDLDMHIHYPGRSLIFTSPFLLRTCP